MDVVFFESCIKSVTTAQRDIVSKTMHPEFKIVCAKYFTHLHKNKKQKAAGHDYRVSRDGMSHIVNEIAQSMSIAAKNHLKINFYNRLTKYKKLEYLINSDDPQKTKISKYELWMRVRHQVIELNAMYKTECFYYVERKPRKEKADGKVKNKDGKGKKMFMTWM